MRMVLPASIRERLLSEAVRRREVSPAALPAIHNLLRHGLSFEQALVGTGLVSSKEFMRWMEEASGLPLLPSSLQNQTLPPGLELETVVAWRIVPQKQGKQHWQIGLVDPWDHEIRATLEALAAEHGWTISFALVTPSVADVWLRGFHEAQRSSMALRRYARDLVERAEKTVVTEHAIPNAWYTALKTRLARRREVWGLDLTHDVKARHPSLRVHREQVPQPPEIVIQEPEHPILDWTPSLEAYFQNGTLVFLMDVGGRIRTILDSQHADYMTQDEWRPLAKRWISPAESEKREELFHLALSGYPGTVCFSSPHVLRDWEQAADDAGVAYVACIGHTTGQGTAWSLYSVHV